VITEAIDDTVPYRLGLGDQELLGERDPDFVDYHVATGEIL
jgi:hypothetical protein